MVSSRPLVIFKPTFQMFVDNGQWPKAYHFVKEPDVASHSGLDPRMSCCLIFRDNAFPSALVYRHLRTRIASKLRYKPVPLVGQRWIGLFPHDPDRHCSEDSCWILST